METVQAGLEKKPFELNSWMVDANMSFYSNAPDNMVVNMDCGEGELQTIYGAASDESYK